MHARYGQRVDFKTVYIREAHPLDEWQMDENEKEDVCYRQPKTLADRVLIANDFVKRFGYPMPLLIDSMQNSADSVYAGWPERLYVIDTTGTIAYKGEQGPFGFHPEEVEQWLASRYH